MTQQKKTITSDSLHNYNCYSYLCKIKISPYVIRLFPAKLKEHWEAFERNRQYNSNFPYADLYKEFFESVEDNINQIYYQARQALKRGLKLGNETKSLVTNDSPLHPFQGVDENYLQIILNTREIEKDLSDLDQFIDSIYTNPNKILEATFNHIKAAALESAPISNGIEHKISHLLQDKPFERVNKYASSPADIDSLYKRARTLFAHNFKPQHTTSLATVRSYEYNKNASRTELRFGTQGQRHRGTERVSPLFECWLTVQARKSLRKNDITHIYFNNLGLYRTSFEGKKEQKLTEALHQLEKTHSNLAVITLPADQKLMNRSDFKKTDDAIDKEEIFNTFKEIVTQEKKGIEHDFYISPTIRNLLFNEVNENDKLTELLRQSFDVMGFKKAKTLSTAQKQAVWVHFIKFQLTDFIIEKLQPNSINFSCKDAIDRGGVSSAYYNLLKSFESETPLSREEFECGLHAAPAMVKGRGMNSHLRLIWNAIDAYIEANYDKLINTPKAWLMVWRDNNCPHYRVEEVLTKRVERVLKDLEEKILPEELKSNARKILTQISQQSLINASGKRLLLEAVTRTETILNAYVHKDRELIASQIAPYQKLSERLEIKFPTLQQLAGGVKTFLGYLIKFLTLGHQNHLIQSGKATRLAASHHEERHDLQKSMKNQIILLSQQDDEKERESSSSTPPH